MNDDYSPRDVTKGTIRAGGVTPTTPSPVKHLNGILFEEAFNGYESVLICHESGEPHQLGAQRNCGNCMNARMLRRDVVNVQEPAQ